MGEKESEKERTCGSVKETGGKNKERARPLRWAVHFFLSLQPHIRQNAKEKYFEDRFMT